ncbi:ras and EF-hand domain-containing protein [Dunckerocampus dactyliophorus]|uniref:ras and EF-hand domain-containing protein n=1 Tax=Dunckerocampus dactyliophorus TaxID=161453 RepID=UPI002405B5CA|nr:ras and EF-hand domain-containing protein [Dunckerocampus dactyliophorus]
MELSNLQRLFSACDVNQSGKIEFEDFTVVCGELNVPESEVQTLFGKFDADEDGCIDYSRFLSRFQEVFPTSLGPGSTANLEFAARFDTEYVLSDSLREQLAELYQTIQTCVNTSVLQQYEQVVRSLVSQSLDNRLECEQLESSLRRAEEMNSSQLSEMEDDIQRQLTGTEERVRAEERKKMEEVLWTMQRKHENQTADLQDTVDRLLKSQEDSRYAHSKEEELKVNKQIDDLTEENKVLHSSLVEAQTNIAVLQSELDKLKNMYVDKQAQHERETNELKKMVIEYQSYASHIQILQDINQQLYDSNDGLRSTLVNQQSLSPRNENPARRREPIRQSTLKHDRSNVDSSHSALSNVSMWADKYLDSGVSLHMDTTESSASDFDTDDGRGSSETVHHSYSYVHSDSELLDARSEAALSVAPSGGSSTASSRKHLPAFPIELPEALPDVDDAVPMYRLVLAGDAGAGKSSFLLRLALNQFKTDLHSTLGVDFQIKKMLVDGEKTNLQIWDTAGQERFRSIAMSYFRKAHGVLLLYDVTSESSFLNIRSWLDQIQDHTGEKVPVCIIGNKVDLREQLPQKRCVSSSHGEKLATAYGALFCETSAKDGTNVVEAVLHLAREVKKNVKMGHQPPSHVKLVTDNAKKTFDRCCRL